ncbi:MAG: hypothetical protein RLZZ200_2248 [Pseudomonadota bacterium]
MSRKSARKVVVLVAGLLQLAACGQPSDASKAARPSTESRPSAAAAADGDWVTAARSSGAELPLVLRFELPQRPLVGAAFPLRLKLEAQNAFEGLSLRALLPPGLESFGASPTVSEPSVTAGGKIEHGISLKADRLGFFELRFQLTLAPQGGKEQTAVYSVPVLVEAQ